MPLSQAMIDHCYVITKVNLSNQIRERGIIEGAGIEVLSNNGTNLIVKIKDIKLGIASSLANKIEVRMIESSASVV